MTGEMHQNNYNYSMNLYSATYTYNSGAWQHFTNRKAKAKNTK